jgi:NAD(P)-dependent dehydrogenase (short-subunit alcohol dehydrogenase family)
MRQTPANDAPKSLVLISSVMGMAPAYGAADYTASKHAVLGLSRALAAPYRKRGGQNCERPPVGRRCVLVPAFPRQHGSSVRGQIRR